MWLPDKFYEALPMIYAGAGLATLWSTDHPVGYGSGIILLLTAFLVWNLRKEYRHLKNTRNNSKR